MPINKNDVGAILDVTVLDNDEPMDVSTATTKQIILKKPDGTTIEYDADFYTDGTDGIIQYTTETNDLDIAGVWFIQAYLVFGSTVEFHTEKAFFIVEPNL